MTRCPLKAPSQARSQLPPLRQALVEEPNGDTVLDMIDLLTLQRAYAANGAALKALDGVLNALAGMGTAQRPPLVSGEAGRIGHAVRRRGASGGGPDGGTVCHPSERRLPEE